MSNEIQVCTSLCKDKLYALPILKAMQARGVFNKCRKLLCWDTRTNAKGTLPDEVCNMQWDGWELCYNVSHTDNRSARCSEVRWRLANKALESRVGFDHIYWHDADMIPTNTDIIGSLLSRETAVASGAYYARAASSPVLVMSSDINASPGTLATSTGVLNDDKGVAKLARPHYIGMGCCLMRRDVLENTEFRPSSAWDENPMLHGEDFHFMQDHIAKGGDPPLVDFNETAWHCAEFGMAVRPIVGDYCTLATFMGPGFSVRNQFGEFRQGEPHDNVPHDMTGYLGPQFAITQGYSLKVEQAQTVDLLARL